VKAEPSGRRSGYDLFTMKQHSGDEIRTIMTEMPVELVEGLRAAHAGHQISEREARWWGYLMFARTGAYEGAEYTIKVAGTGEEVTQRFLSYVLEGRASDARFGLIRKLWPESGFDIAPAK
jgi:hypothetical protein